MENNNRGILSVQLVSNAEESVVNAIATIFETLSTEELKNNLLCL